MAYRGRKRAAGSGSAGVDDGSGPLLSPELAALVGATHLKRTEVVKRIWEYIKANGLQVRAARNQAVPVLHPLPPLSPMQSPSTHTQQRVRVLSTSITLHRRTSPAPTVCVFTWSWLV